MRTLVLLRGIPGCGKSSFIRYNCLEPYTISSDSIRMLLRSPVIRPDGNFAIAQKDNPAVWKLIFEILEKRMQNGDFTIIDACHIKDSEIRAYSELIDKYKYRCIVLDFLLSESFGVEKCVENDLNRKGTPGFVGAAVIRKMYEKRMQSGKLPSKFNVVDPEYFWDAVAVKPIDVSRFDKVKIIGDIHGCYNTLIECLGGEELDDNTLYIFCGDYIERGAKSPEVIKFLIKNIDKENVCCLEGNHERHIGNYINHGESSEIVNELLKSGISEKDLKKFWRKLRQISYILYKHIILLISHGGVPVCTELYKVSTNDFIYGAGGYKDCEEMYSTFYNLRPGNMYLVHGHRNVENYDIIDQYGKKIFNLENCVEGGGYLRAIEVYADDDNLLRIDTLEVECNQEDMLEQVRINKIETVDDLITSMESNPNINAKSLQDNIKSYNFTREAFFKKNWSKQTIMARGLFVDTFNKKIIARSYNKFFNIGEIEESVSAGISNLDKLTYPVNLYTKYNGFLGIVSYNPYTCSLFISTKSTTSGDHVKYFKDILKEKLLLEPLKDYLSKNDVSLVFEVIDPVNDPHIIRYYKEDVYLLDAIKNDITFEKEKYEDLKQIGIKLNVKVKELAYTFKDPESLKEFVDNCINENSEERDRVEGYVIEDSNSNMLKVKNKFYSEWKMVRSYINRLKNGANTSSIPLPYLVSSVFMLISSGKIDVNQPIPDIIDIYNKYRYVQ